MSRMTEQESEHHGTDVVYVAEAAEMLRASVRTVHRMAADGRLKVAARGRGLRGTLAFYRRDVEALARQVDRSVAS